MHPDRSWWERFAPGSLQTRLVTLFGVIAAFLLATIGWITYTQQSAEIEAVTDRLTHTHADYIADSIPGFLRSGDFHAIENLLLTTSNIEYLRLVQVIDTQGQVVAEVEHLGEQSRFSLHRPLILETPGEVREESRRVGMDSIVWHPINHDGQLGWVRLEYSLEEMFAQQNVLFWKISLTMLAFLALAVLVSMPLIKWTLQPLSRLRNSATALMHSSGQLPDMKNEPVEISAIGRALTMISMSLQDHDSVEDSWEKSLYSIVERMSCAVWIYSADGRQLRYLNSAYEEIWGHSRERIYKEPRIWLEAVWPLDKERVTPLVNLAETDDLEYRITRADGTPRWVKDQCFVLRNAKGMDQAIIRVSTDMGPVTETEEHSEPVAGRRTGVTTKAPAILDLEWVAKQQAKILVADDNDINRALMASLLKERGAEVVTVADGRQAVERAVNDSFDAIILDIHMPNMSGIDAAVEIRRREPEGKRTPIIALTADVLIEEREHLPQYGIDDLLVKPVSEHALWLTLQKWCQPDNGYLGVLKGILLDEVPIDPDMLPAIDGELAMKQAGGCRDTAEEMFKKLLRMLPQQQLTINHAYAASDMKLLNDEVHKLHGSTCYCGVPALRCAADHLERLIKTGKGTRLDITSSVASLNAQIDRLLTANIPGGLH